jgi:hypothetical protein
LFYSLFFFFSSFYKIEFIHSIHTNTTLDQLQYIYNEHKTHTHTHTPTLSFLSILCTFFDPFF